MDEGERAPLVGKSNGKPQHSSPSSAYRTVGTWFVAVVVASVAVLNVAEYVYPGSFWLFYPPKLRLNLDANGMVTEWPRRCVNCTMKKKILRLSVIGVWNTHTPRVAPLGPSGGDSARFYLSHFLRLFLHRLSAVSLSHALTY